MVATTKDHCGKRHGSQTRCQAWAWWLLSLGGDSWEPLLSPSFVLEHREVDDSILRHSSALWCLH